MPDQKQYIDRLVKFVRHLGDIRFAGQVLFVLVVLLLSWSGIKTIQTNYGLQKQITTLNQRNQLQKLQNDNLALQNQYFQSDQYLELAARQNFGLAARGETEILVPPSIALKHTVDLPNSNPQKKAVDQQPAYERNFEAWVNFFLHRPSNGR